MRRTSLVLWLLLCGPALAEQEPLRGVALFQEMAAADTKEQLALVPRVRATWHPSYVPMVLEVWRFSRSRKPVLSLIDVMQDKTKQNWGGDFAAWFRWLWSQPDASRSDYAAFKSALYRSIDPKFEKYFDPKRKALIRLDEVRWGGVRQDGIPPLRSPKMIAADAAKYLAATDVVFGIVVNGDARAYPKRILAWHEMFVDTVGNVPVAGVYCTLCGSMILYETKHGTTNHALGTSGFLYRSNKLMYDRATQSLWSTLEGKPVIGPLASRGIRLRRRSAVTTTWGEWKRRHPKSSVLSIATGHSRDYAEGAAYRDYFATDRLMFDVPKLDTRLKNKDEVLALWFPKRKGKPLALSAGYLAKRSVHHDAVGALKFVVLTDTSGANRVYEARGVRIVTWDRDRTAIDENGTRWTVTESAMVAGEETRARLPAHRAFWFGWYAAFPDTRLVR